VTGPRLATALASALVLLACGPSGGPATSSPEPPRCDPRVSVPDGFRVTGSIEDPARDHTGVRIDLEAEDGRELHYFAGIAGEFGEGLPDRGEVELADGSTGRLSGEDRTWVLEWEGEPPCTPLVVLGTGMGSSRFDDTLRRVGVLPAR
jgi:hypothetical protein